MFFEGVFGFVFGRGLGGWMSLRLFLGMSLCVCVFKGACVFRGYFGQMLL